MSATGNNNLAGSEKNKNILRPVSMRLMYDGMVVNDDIYDSSSEKMLMAAGTTLTSDHIERMYRLNGGRDVVYVTGRTYKSMVSKRPNIEIDRRKDLENATGYATVLTVVNELYKEIIDTKKVDRERFINLGNDLTQILRNTQPDVLLSVINAIAHEDGHLLRHFINVALLNGLLGTWLGLSEDYISKLVLVGLVHDCGHALMPQELLHTPRIFTKLDFEVIKMHPLRTAELLADFPDDIRLPASAHHERIDGRGYPRGITGSSVIGAARITAISDIYEAVVTKRSYRSVQSPFYVLDMFDDMTPMQIDNDAVNVFKENLPKLLVDKPVTMSDGTIGIIREYDAKDIKYPMVELNRKVIKTNEALCCMSMYLDE